MEFNKKIDGMPYINSSYFYNQFGNINTFLWLIEYNLKPEFIRLNDLYTLLNSDDHCPYPFYWSEIYNMSEYLREIMDDNKKMNRLLSSEQFQKLLYHIAKIYYAEDLYFKRYAVPGPSLFNAIANNPNFSHLINDIFSKAIFLLININDQSNLDQISFLSQFNTMCNDPDILQKFQNEQFFTDIKRLGNNTNPREEIIKKEMTNYDQNLEKVKEIKQDLSRFIKFSPNARNNPIIQR